MNGKLQRLGRLGILMLALHLPTVLSGCMHTNLETVDPTFARTVLCQSMPVTCRNRVYVFCLNGYDLLDCANLNGLQEQLQDLGYIKVYVGYFHHYDYFYDEIQRIHHCEPTARFAIVGAGHGSTQASELARRAASASIPVDLLASLDGDEKAMARYKHPGVLKVLHIHGADSHAGSNDKSSGEHVIIPDSGYWGLATRPLTIDTILHEVTIVASHIPLIQYVPVQPGEQLSSPPEAVSSMKRDDWDFLLVKGPIPQPGNENSDLPVNARHNTEVPGIISDPKAGGDKLPLNQGPLKRPPLEPGKKYLLDDLR